MAAEESYTDGDLGNSSFSALKSLSARPERLSILSSYLLGGLSVMWCIERGLAMFA